MAPALVPTSREVGVGRRAVIFKSELLCCLMMASYPGWRHKVGRLNSCKFGRDSCDFGYYPSVHEGFSVCTLWSGGWDQNSDMRNLCM